jgi:WD40-like Beta Propeller Repeat
MMRLIGMRAVKVVAAAAAVCVAALSACTASPRSPVNVPANTSLPPPGGMPGYYVVVAGPEVVVRASADGHVTGSVVIPGPAGTPRALVGGEPFASADGRRFVIVVSRGGDLPGVADVALFRLTVSPDGRPGTLSQLNFDSRGMPVIGAALSPDGRMLALSLVHEFLPDQLHGSAEVINIASGATRTWTGQSAPGYWPGVPAWAGDGTVVVPWWHDTGNGMGPAEITGVRQLNLAAPGGSLAAARLVAFPVPVPGLQSALLVPGGGEVITSSCRAGHHTATVRIAELSATDGRLVRVLRTQTARFGSGAAVADAVFSQCQVLSAADGDHVLVQAFAFGRIDNGAFTSLPGTSPRVLPVSAAW